jgi:hypothetical protein
MFINPDQSYTAKVTYIFFVYVDAFRIFFLMALLSINVYYFASTKFFLMQAQGLKLSKVNYFVITVTSFAILQYF